MAKLTGSPSEMDEQARKLSDEELTEIAYLNDTPPAFKARAELQRRNTEFNTRTLFWARLAGAAAVAALVMTVIAALAP
jgi:hypothetical protein